MQTNINLKQHYKNILDRNREAISSGGTKDEYLADAVKDGRYSIALLIRIPAEIRNNILMEEERIKSIEPNLYYYPGKDMHITVMDILKGEEGRQIPENIEEYAACISDCAVGIKPFNISFRGLTASDSAVMVCGYYDEELQKLRASMRQKLNERGLELQERYETISSHITIARNKDGITNPQLLLKNLEEDISFGQMQVEALELTYHNWYDTQKIVIKRIELVP